MHSALFAFYNDGVIYSFNYSDDEDKICLIIEVGLLIYHISVIPYSISDGRVALLSIVYCRFYIPTGRWPCYIT